jgi:hypothetical protein
MKKPRPNRLVLFLGIVLSVTNIALIVFVLGTFISKDNNQADSGNQDIQGYSNSISDIYATTFLDIDQTIKLSNGFESLPIRDTLGKKYSLFYCFSSTDCRDCVIEEIRLFTSVFSHKETEGIGMIMKSNDSFNFPNRAYWGSRYFETNKSILPGYEAPNRSYFILVQSATFQCGLLFYPDLHNPRLTIDYLLQIKRRFFSD